MPQYPVVTAMPAMPQIVQTVQSSVGCLLENSECRLVDGPGSLTKETGPLNLSGEGRCHSRGVTCGSAANEPGRKAQVFPKFCHFLELEGFSCDALW